MEDGYVPSLGCSALMETCRSSEVVVAVMFAQSRTIVLTLTKGTATLISPFKVIYKLDRGLGGGIRDLLCGRIRPRLI